MTAAARKADATGGTLEELRRQLAGVRAELTQLLAADAAAEEEAGREVAALEQAGSARVAELEAGGRFAEAAAAQRKHAGELADARAVATMKGRARDRARQKLQAELAAIEKALDAEVRRVVVQVVEAGDAAVDAALGAAFSAIADAMARRWAANHLAGVSIPPRHQLHPLVEELGRIFRGEGAPAWVAAETELGGLEATRATLKSRVEWARSGQGDLPAAQRQLKAFSETRFTEARARIEAARAAWTDQVQAWGWGALLARGGK